MNGGGLETRLLRFGSERIAVRQLGIAHDELECRYRFRDPVLGTNGGAGSAEGV